MGSFALYALRWRLPIGAIVAVLQILSLGGPARADLIISTSATQNVHCDNAKCRAKAADAVLNVSQLQNMLAEENVTVTTAETTGPNIVVSSPLTWVSAKSLTLDAYTSVAVNASITVAGPGGLSIITNDGGYGGTFSVADDAAITFWSTSNKLAINRIHYQLVDNIESLAAAVKAHRAGFFALSKSYDASADGTFKAAPVGNFAGTLEGLGNTISNLSIKARKGRDIGLIAGTYPFSVIQDLNLVGLSVVSQVPGSVGGLVADSSGSLSNDVVTGTVSAPGDSATGLLVGSADSGTIANSHSNGTVRGLYGGGLIGAIFDDGFGSALILDSSSTASVKSPGDQGHASAVGGLIGYADDNTTIENSWSKGKVTAGSSASAGGLAGYSSCAVIIGSFSTGAVSTGDNGVAGGLVGSSQAPGICGGIGASYATGPVKGGAGSYDGGLVGSCGCLLLNDLARGKVTGGQGGFVGGLVGYADCQTMDQVSASGNVTGGSKTGGLVGFNVTAVSNAYATGAVNGTANGDVGGLLGHSVETVSNSYAAGAVTGNGAQYAGGLIGEDQEGQYQNLSDTYWDLTTSGISSLAQGAGNISNDPGVTGKTDRQLKKQLPSGFDTTLWGLSSQINGGLPYLLGNGFAAAHQAYKFPCSARLAARFANLCKPRAKL